MYNTWHVDDVRHCCLFTNSCWYIKYNKSTVSLWQGHRGRCGCDRMVVYNYRAISVWETHWSQCVLDATLCDKVCQWLATGRWFSPGIPVSSTNKTDLHDILEMLLKVNRNIICSQISFISTCIEDNHINQQINA